MKKIFSVILMLSMVLMLFSCTGNQVSQNETTKVENVAGETANTAEEDFSNYVPKGEAIAQTLHKKISNQCFIYKGGIGLC